jgi:hypothetical protein
MRISGEWFRGGGAVVALVGFGVTRLFVAETVVTEASTAFLLASVVSLVVGLGLTVYGVVLAVGSFSREYVGVVTQWCLLGTAGMFVVLALSSTESLLSGGTMGVVAESPTLTANVLLGGAVGGVLIGTRSASNGKQRRELERRGNQALLVNRLLRHEVVNAATVVKGYSEHLDDEREVPTDPIREEAQRIVDTIDEVGDVTTEAGDNGIDVAAAVEREVRTLREVSGDASVSYDGPSEGAEIDPGGRLDVAVRNLLEYATEVSSASTVAVELTQDTEEVVLSVSHDGRPFSDRERALLSDGEFPEYDDPTTGFRVGIVRLLTTRANGRISVSEGEANTTVTVRFPRADTVPDVSRAIAVTKPNFGRAAVAGVLAGVAMGAYAFVTSDTISVIGALYGVESQVVGWTTHLFHSVVFAVLFAAGCSHERLRQLSQGVPSSTASGMVWGAILWLFAAGVVMPLWLQFVGVPAMLPNFSFPGLVSHLLWGGVLGISYSLLGGSQVPEYLSR